MSDNGRRKTHVERVHDRAKRILRLCWLFSSTRETLAFRAIRERIPDSYPSNFAAALRSFERDKEVLHSLGLPLRYEAPVGNSEGGYTVDRTGPAIARPRLTDAAMPAVRALSTMLRSSPTFPDRSRLVLALAKLGGLPLPASDASAQTENVVIGHPADVEAFVATNLRLMDEAIRARKLATFLHETIGGRLECVTIEPYALKLPSVVVGNVPGKGVRTFRLINMHNVSVNAEQPKSPDFPVPSAEAVESTLERPSWRLPVHESERTVLEVDETLAAMANGAFPGATLHREGRWIRYTMDVTNQESVVEWALMVGGDWCRIVEPNSAVLRMRELLAFGRAPQPSAAKLGVSSRSGDRDLVGDAISLAVICHRSPGMTMDDAALWLGCSAAEVSQYVDILNDAAADEPGVGVRVETKGCRLWAENTNAILRALRLTPLECRAVDLAGRFVASSGLDELHRSSTELIRLANEQARGEQSHSMVAGNFLFDPISNRSLEIARQLMAYAEHRTRVDVTFFDDADFTVKTQTIVPIRVHLSGGGYCVVGQSADGSHACISIDIDDDVVVAESHRAISDSGDVLESKSFDPDLPQSGLVKFLAPLADVIPRAWLPGAGRRTTDGSVVVEHPYHSRHFFFGMLRRYGSAAELLGPPALLEEYRRSLKRIVAYYQ
jgi:predicted DNA-binding transcriptional regulator YafY